MVRNSAHDSICACSVDDVVDAVLHRYAEARAIAAGLADRALKTFARSLAARRARRCSTRRRGPGPGVVELVVPADGPAPADVQVLSERSGLPGSMVLDADTVRTVLGMLQGPRISDDAWIHDVPDRGHDEGIDITIAVGTEEKPDVPIAEAKQDVYTRLGARPDAVVRVAMDQPSTRRIAGPRRRGARLRLGAPSSRRRWPTRSRSTEADGVGRRWPTGWCASTSTRRRHLRPRRHARLRPAGRRRRPRRLLQLLAAAPGLVRGHARSPSSSGSTSAVRCGRGPRITTTYAWPDHVDGASQARVGEPPGRRRHRRRGAGRRGHGAGHDRLREPERRPPPAGPPPLPEPASTREAESAFTVVERGLTAEGRPDEFGLPTAPANRFVTAGGLTVVHEGVLEYELVDIEGDAAHTAGPDPPAVDRHAVPARHGLPALPGGPAHAGGGPADAGQAGRAALRAGARLRRPLPAGRRRPAPARARREPRRWPAPGLGQRAGGRTGPRSARSTGWPACSRSGSSTRPPSRPWCRSRVAPAGSSTCGATPRRPSRAPSSYAPSASPPPGCATV